MAQLTISGSGSGLEMNSISGFSFNHFIHTQSSINAWYSQEYFKLYKILIHQIKY